MRWVALTGMVRAFPQGDGHPGQRIEVPLSGGRSFRVDDLEFRELTSGEHDEMTFERALLFARAGRNIRCRHWEEGAYIATVNGTLRWCTPDGEARGLLLPGDDMLATDWIVLP